MRGEGYKINIIRAQCINVIIYNYKRKFNFLDDMIECPSISCGVTVIIVYVIETTDSLLSKLAITLKLSY